MNEYREYLNSQFASMLLAIATLVNIETPSGQQQQCLLAAEFIANLIKENTGITAEIIDATTTSPKLVAQVGNGKGGVILIGHFDTVHPLATLQQHPFRQVDNKIFGPGVYDMKTGIIQAIFALKAVLVQKPILHKKVTLLFNCDEEIGSPKSRDFIEIMAQKHDYALIMEISTEEQGHLKVARKGSAAYSINIYGKSSHAGNHPELGIDAIVEAAKLILKLHEFNDRNKGISINCGVVKGGSSKGTIAEFAQIEAELRTITVSDLKELDKKIRELQPFNEKISLKVEGGIGRLPFEQSPQSKELFDLANAIRKQAGLAELPGELVGGGSDGNNTSQYIPTLDGLGPVGGGAHTVGEWVNVDYLVERTALVAALIAKLTSAAE